MPFFAVLLDMLTLTRPTIDSYADSSVSKLSQQRTLKANWGGTGQSFKDQKDGAYEFNKNISLKFSAADHKDGKPDQV